MPNDYLEDYGSHDMDSDLEEKKQIIQEAKEASETLSDAEAIQRVSALRKQWNRIQNWDSQFEEELQNEFDTITDAVFAKRDEIQKAAAEKKQALIARSEELLKSENLGRVVSDMNALMDEWKAAGSAGRKTDDELWEQFNGLRKEFFARRHEQRKAQLEQFDQVRQVKLALIEKAKEVTAEPKNWNQTTEEVNKLMEEWKAAGSAGNKYENDLWNEFRTIRSEFFSARSSYYQTVRQQQQTRYEAKKELIAKVQAVLDEQDFSREAVDKVKAVSQEWKEVGYCGKDRDDAVWKEFRAVMDAYFDEIGKQREAKHQNWVDRMEDNKAYKQKLIRDQERQIRRLEDELGGLISQAHAEELEDMIAEKEQLIEDLENEIKEIDERIAG
jgi:hypothetical protein